LKKYTTTYIGEKTACSTNVDPCLSFCAIINSKWIEDHNARPSTLKLLQQNIGEKNTLTDRHHAYRQLFSEYDSITQEIRARTEKWDCVKSKNFAYQRKNYQTREKTPRKGENLCQLFIC
jgi:hypothetical protein